MLRSGLSGRSTAPLPPTPSSWLSQSQGCRGGWDSPGSQGSPCVHTWPPACRGPGGAPVLLGRAVFPQPLALSPCALLPASCLSLAPLPQWDLFPPTRPSQLPSSPSCGSSCSQPQPRPFPSAPCWPPSWSWRLLGSQGEGTPLQQAPTPPTKPSHQATYWELLTSS